MPQKKPLFIRSHSLPEHNTEQLKGSPRRSITNMLKKVSNIPRPSLMLPSELQDSLSMAMHSEAIKLSRGLCFVSAFYLLIHQNYLISIGILVLFLLGIFACQHYHPSRTIRKLYLNKFNITVPIQMFVLSCMVIIFSPQGHYWQYSFARFCFIVFFPSTISYIPQSLNIYGFKSMYDRLGGVDTFRWCMAIILVLDYFSVRYYWPRAYTVPSFLEWSLILMYPQSRICMRMLQALKANGVDFHSSSSRKKLSYISLISSSFLLTVLLK